MTHGIQVRKALLHDCDVITHFNIAMARETEKKELSLPVVSQGVKGLFAQPQYGFYVVAENEGVVLGSLMITPEWSDWRNGVFWWIQSVYVRPEWRNRGVYRELYAFVKNKAEAEPAVCGFRLYVEKENHKAQKTYQTLGMQETSYRLYEEEKQRD